jgi:hypothetical protein
LPERLPPIPLRGERYLHHLLLFLAQKTIDDKAAGLTEAEQGWLEKDSFIEMLQLGETLINRQIYQLTKQLLKVLPEYLVLPQMIERRKSQLRFVCENVRIQGGN